MQNTVQEVKETEEMKDFETLMQEVAELPKQQVEKVSYFAQGVLAMAADKKKEAK